MDIVLDCGDLFFGRNASLDIERNLTTLYNNMNKITVSSELPSASLFASVKSSLQSVIGDDMDDLITRLDNIIKLLRENDQEAAYLFNYYEEGIINGDFGFTEMPLMDQTDYTNIRYSQGTISTSGCGLTSICMVASYLTGDLYTPAELVEATRGKTDNVSRMLAAAASVGLVWHNDSGTSREDLKNYLRDGNIAVVLVRDSSHFVVCTGITEDGKVLVNDPYGPRATDQALTLEQLDFSAGNTWIFNPEENKGVKKELNDKIVADQTLADLIMNEGSYSDRTSQPTIVTLPSEGNPNPGNTGDQTVTLSGNPNGNPSQQPTTQAPQTSAPVEKPQQPTTQAPQTSAPVERPQQPTTQAPQTSAPVERPQQPTTQAPQTSAPVERPQQPTTQAPQTSAPVERPQQPTTQAPQTSAPVERPQQPTTQAPQTSAPVERPQQPTTQVPQTSAPVVTYPSGNDYSNSSIDNNYSNNTSDSSINTSDYEYKTSVGDNSSSAEEYTFTSPFDDVKDETTSVNNYSSSENHSSVSDESLYSKESSSVEVPKSNDKDNSSKFVAPLIAGVASVAAAGGAYAVLNKKKEEKSDKKDSDSDNEGVLSKLGFDK